MIENRWIGKLVIEGIIRFLRPKVSAFDWTFDGNTDTYLLRIRGGPRLRIDQTAVDQAADEREALPRLKMEVERALLGSESGTATGLVMET